MKKVSGIPIFLRSVRPLKTFFFFVLMISGVVLRISVNSSIESLTSLLLKIVLVTSLWQYTIVLNNIYDEKIDKTQKRETPITRRIISKSSYMKFGIVLALASIIFSVLLGQFAFIIVSFIFIIAGTVYSVPPFRLRKHVFSTFFIGLGSILSLFIGYFEYSPLFLWEVNPPLTQDLIKISLLLFFATSIGATTKDIKDYRGDKKSGVSTIFTIFGLKNGKRITSILLFISFLIPLILFYMPWEIALFFTTSLIATLIFIRLENTNIVIILSFIIFLYCLIRIASV